MNEELEQVMKTEEQAEEQAQELQTEEQIQAVVDILLQYQKYIQSKQDKRVYERECTVYAEQIVKLMARCKKRGKKQ